MKRGCQSWKVISLSGLPCALCLSLVSCLFTVDAQDTAPYSLYIATHSSQVGLCKKSRTEPDIRLAVANHRDLLLQRVPGQHVPGDHEQARRKAYVYFLELADLSDGRLHDGAIAFNTEHAVIFTRQFPKGLARREYIAQLPPEQRIIGEKTLETFLILHPLFNVLIDACRPYPTAVTYATDDEFDKIEAAKRAYREMAKAYNRGSLARRDIPWEPGTAGGFIDPGANGKQVSYQAMNPLNFYEASPVTADSKFNKKPAEPRAARHETMRVVATVSNNQ